MTMKAEPINDWELTTTCNAVNIVVVGKAGNGKSATGNSILGRKAFFSKLSPSGVTCTSELQGSALKDGRIVNVIDTPGLFDFSIDSDVISGEIVKCIDLAKDGIHALLMVFSIRSRFTREEQAAVESMKSLFGDEIVNYMIIVFTGGDSIDCNQESMEDYFILCPEPLRMLIQLCNNRAIIFDNVTKDMTKRERQVNKLLSLVESVISGNGKKPYTNEIFAKVKEGALLRQQKDKEAEAQVGLSKEKLSEVMKENLKSYDDQLKRVTEMVEEKLKLTMESLNQQLAKEQAARLETERLARESLKKSDEEIWNLKVKLDKAKLEAEVLAGKYRKESGEEIQKLKENLNHTQLEKERLAEKLLIQSNEQIQKLEAELHDTRRQSEDFKRHVAEQQKCAIL